MESNEALALVKEAPGLDEALSIVVQNVLVPEGIERALVVIGFGSELRGVHGMGCDVAQVRGLAIPLGDEAHPVVAGFYGGEPTTIRLPRATEHLDSGQYLLLPLKGWHARPYGAVLIGPGERTIRSVEAVIRALGALEFALQSHAERAWPRQPPAEFKRERDLLEAVVDALPDPVFVTNADNAVILLNRRADSLFMTGADDSDGRRRAIEINNLIFSSYLTQSAISGAEPVSRELNLVDPNDGADLLFEVLITPVSKDLAGEHASVSVLKDVTDLKQASTEFERQFKRLRQLELKSRRERDRLNMILENVGDPILVTDDQSNIILMNREAERLFDVPVASDQPPQSRKEVRGNDTKFSYFVSDFALSADVTRVAYLSLTDPDTGLEFPAEAVSGKVLDERSEVAVIVSILHDLTEVVENKRLAAQLARMNESLEERVKMATGELEERNRTLEWQSRELEQAYRLQSQFLASMSHELRTPINSLLGYTSLMRDEIYGELAPPQQEAMERMYLASSHLLELVNDILDLARIEAGKMPVHVEPVDVGEIIRELEQTVEPMVRDKKLELVVSSHPDLPIVETDRTKVKQVVLNLLSNAVKYTKQGRVRVLAGPTGGKEEKCGPGVAIEVSDTGIGIEEGNIEAIFDDFRQLDPSSTREYGGTGLGLSITKKLLNLLGGTIQVESRVGEGSTFTVCLPLKSEERLREPNDVVAAAERTGGRHPASTS